MIEENKMVIEGCVNCKNNIKSRKEGDLVYCKRIYNKYIYESKRCFFFNKNSISEVKKDTLHERLLRDYPIRAYKCMEGER